MHTTIQLNKERFLYMAVFVYGATIEDPKMGSRKWSMPLYTRSYTLAHTLHSSADTGECIDQEVLHRGPAFLHSAGKSV